MKVRTYVVMLSAILGDMPFFVRGEEKESEVSKSKILTLFHQVQDAKTRGAVEKVLGEPIFVPLVQKDGSSSCWYLEKPERTMQLHESPWGMGGIVVEYDKNEKVVSSRFNFQWVEEKDVQEYRRQYGAEQGGGGKGEQRR